MTATGGLYEKILAAPSVGQKQTHNRDVWGKIKKVMRKPIAELKGFIIAFNLFPTHHHHSI